MANRTQNTNPNIEDGFFHAAILLVRMILDVCYQFVEGLGLGRAVFLEDTLEADDSIWIRDGAERGRLGEVRKRAAALWATKGRKPTKGSARQSRTLSFALRSLHIGGDGGVSQQGVSRTRPCVLMRKSR
jgi:hypothetical protein